MYLVWVFCISHTCHSSYSRAHSTRTQSSVSRCVYTLIACLRKDTLERKCSIWVELHSLGYITHHESMTWYCYMIRFPYCMNKIELVLLLILLFFFASSFLWPILFCCFVTSIWICMYACYAVSCFYLACHCHRGGMYDNMSDSAGSSPIQAYPSQGHCRRSSCPDHHNGNL